METPIRVLYHGSVEDCYHEKGLLMRKDDPVWGTIIDLDMGVRLWHVRQGSYTIIEETA